MTATDELRRLLDKRGVEWWQSANTLGCVFTRWYSPLFGDEVVAMENGEEGLVLFDHFMTPEQAVEATLGRGTCKLDGYTDAAFRVVQATNEADFIDYAEVCECSACGASVIVPHEYERVSAGSDELWPKFNYCPNCGRKVVDA